MECAVFKVMVPHLGSQMGQLIMVSPSQFLIQATLNLMRKPSLLFSSCCCCFCLILGNAFQNGGGLGSMLMLSKGVGQGAGAQNGYGGYPTKGVGGGLNSNLFCSFLISLLF